MFQLRRWEACIFAPCWSLLTPAVRCAPKQREHCVQQDMKVMAHLKNGMCFILIQEEDTSEEEARGEAGDVVRGESTEFFYTMPEVQKLFCGWQEDNKNVFNHC